MKISVISTVKNENQNITAFANSVLKQTRKPDEFIIVDGGSTDGTWQTLNALAKKNKNLKVIQREGANISTGRNIAIKNAKNPVIATVDGGSKYDINWLKELERGFNGKVSFGKDVALIENDFQKALARVILHKSVCGSSRNMIFLKKIWEEVGGYPEDLLIGEDTLYDERIKKAGYTIGKIDKAICKWEMRKDMTAFKRQFYRYGYWDGVSYKKYGMLPKKHLLVVLFLIVTFPLYPLFWIISKISLVMRIKFYKRYKYLRGFIKGYLGGKE